MNTLSLIGFLIALVIGLCVAFPLGKALKKYPMVFYSLSVVIVGVYAWAVGTGVRLNDIRFLTIILQKGYLSVVFLGIVMFTGCIEEGTTLRKKLQPIRGELSILSFIFIINHLISYAPGYLMKVDAIFASKTNIALSLIVAIILTALFAVLTVTSFQWVRAKMSPKAWRNLQRTSYVMMALLLGHILLVMWKSAFASDAILAKVTLACYVVVLAVYAILRVRKYLSRSSVEEDKAQ